MVKELRAAADWLEQPPPPSNDGMPRRPLNRMLREAADEIERLQKLVDLAVDAYNAGGEDECCVACMKIYEQKDAALA